jgi:hypothetical protein
MKLSNSKRNNNASLEAILGTDEFPQFGWVTRGERTWRMGSRKVSTPASRRAGEQGRIECWRIFEHVGDDRWLWIQVSPFLTSEDAASMLEGLEDRLEPNSSATVSVLRQDVFCELSIDGNVFPWALEQFTSDGDRHAVSRTVSIVEGLSGITVSGIGPGNGMPWTDVAEIATLQATKIASMDRLA